MSRQSLLLYFFVVFSWSSSWLPLKWQTVENIPPIVSVFWRFVIASAILLVIVKWKNIPLSGFSRRRHLQFFALGVCLFSMNFTFFYYASINVVSGLLAVVLASAAFINIILESIIKRSPPKTVHLLAALLGLFGVFVLYFPILSDNTHAAHSLILAMMGTMCFCAGNMISAKLQRNKISIGSSTCWGMMYGVFVLTILVIAFNKAFIIEVTPRYVISMAWLSVVATLLSFYCYLQLLGRIGVVKASYATALFPVFALLLSIKFENYHWDYYASAGLLLIIIGNIIMAKSK